MKKLLSILLTLAIAPFVAIFANAAVSPPDAQANVVFHEDEADHEHEGGDDDGDGEDDAEADDEGDSEE